MGGRRVVHKKYGAGEVIDHTFIGQIPITYVRFDLHKEEIIVPDSELEPEIKELKIDEKDSERTEEIRTEALEELKEIQNMNNESLIENFEFIVRQGAGPSSRRVVFIKREILSRMHKKVV